MNFKKLALDRAKIDDALSTYSEQATIEGPVQKKGYVEYKVGLPEGKPALLHFYFRGDGSTTINPRVGTNQSLSIELAELVCERCQAQKTNRGHLYIKHLSEENFELMCAFLREECGATIDAPTDISHGRQYKAHGVQGDTLSLNYFDNGAFQVQGKPLLLYSEIIEILSELLDYKDIVDPQLKLIDTGISSADVSTELQQALPSSHIYLGRKIQAIMAPAFAWLKIEVDLPDYSSMVFPALRGLEGYLKLLFAEHGIIIDRRDGFSPYFRSDPAHLTVEALEKVKCEKTCRALERVYDYYKRHRHGIFHVDATPETTKIVDKRHEADGIIRKSLDLIEETYTSIHV